MQDEKVSGEQAGVGDKVTERHKRVDTEHRGVTGTLVLTDVLDDKVRRIPCAQPDLRNSELHDSH